MMTLGAVIILITLFMDVSVSSGAIGGRVVNMGLVNAQQTWLWAGSALFVSGSVFFAVSFVTAALAQLSAESKALASELMASGRSTEAARVQGKFGVGKPCPRCAEAVKQTARVCRYCGYEFPDEPGQQIAKPSGANFGEHLGDGIGRISADDWNKFNEALQATGAQLEFTGRKYIIHSAKAKRHFYSDRELIEAMRAYFLPQPQSSDPSQA